MPCPSKIDLIDMYIKIYKKSLCRYMCAQLIAKDLLPAIKINFRVGYKFNNSITTYDFQNFVFNVLNVLTLF